MIHKIFVLPMVYIDNIDNSLQRINPKSLETPFGQANKLFTDLPSSLIGCYDYIAQVVT